MIKAYPWGKLFVLPVAIRSDKINRRGDFVKHEKLFGTIDDLYEKYLKVWIDICNIESPTYHKSGIDNVGKYIINLSKSHGWDIDVIPCEKAGNAICITMNGNAENAPICISGHIDTVHEVGSFGTPAVYCDDEKIYGPGVLDCKGGVVSGLLAMHALSEIGFSNRPVRLLVQTDEEVGSVLSKRKTINYIIEKARSSVAFLNLEGHTKNEGCIERKGIITFTFSIKGIAAHSARCAQAGANAILDAAHKIIELEKFKDPDGLTCNCAVIRGGDVANSVPDFCEFKANVRFKNQEQLEHIRNFVKELAVTAHVKGCICTVNNPKERVAMEHNLENEALLNRMNEIYAECGLPILTASRRVGGSDAADITAAGIPCVDSLGVTGGNIHTKNEFAYLTSLKEASKRIASVVLYI